MRKSKNIVRQKYKISKESRNKLLGYNSVVVWLTGLSGSGKSTIANEVEKILFEKDKILTYVLDGDNLRHGLNKDLGFSRTDRKENIRRVAEVAQILVDSGIVVLTAFISPYIKDRNEAKKIIGKKNFLEIYVKAPVELCEKRDVKGLYKKARTGKLGNLTGIQTAYESPKKPELVIDTEQQTIKESANLLYNFVRRRLKL